MMFLREEENVVKYPKPVMTMTELRKMGFTRGFLDRAYKFPGQMFSWKSDPFREGSVKMFDTAAFEKWRQEQMKLERI